VEAGIEKSFGSRWPSAKLENITLSRRGLTPSEKDVLVLAGTESVYPSCRVMAVNGIYPWGRMTEKYVIVEESYPLVLKGSDPFDREKWKTLVQTGVTAMTRTFMRVVDRENPLEPVRETMPITSSADLALTSNEVSFVPGCRLPLKNNLSFCSPPAYLSILTESGFDVIELTGNHNNDYGREYNLKTQKLYRQKGIRYFGGGADLQEAREVLYLPLGGSTVAFMGSNEWGPEPAWATSSSPGANPLDEKWLKETITGAGEKADIIYVSFQWGNENDPRAWKSQRRLSRSSIDLGATIVTSSSAHRAMGIEFYRGRLICYGLGNFLFDQMQTIHHRRGLVARHHFYEGRHIQTELIPYMIHDYSRPVLLHGREAEDLLGEVYRHSLGPVFRAP
jgi:poly-gamma-glutamate synthesis protein (capsule biosynthesis protein)